MGFPGSILLKQGDQFKQSSSKIHPLGTRGYTRDGRVFRYAHAGGTISQAGLVLQAAAQSATKNSVFSTDYSIISTAMTAYKIYPASSKPFRSSQDNFADGYMFVNDSTGSTSYVGQMIQIKSHTNATATGVKVTINPYDNELLSNKLTTKTQLTFIQNLYEAVIECPKTLTSVPVGVAPRPVTSDYYFWCQTWGPCPVLACGTLTIGAPVQTAGGTDTGSVARITTGCSTATAPTHRNPIIGNCLAVVASDETNLIDLHLAP